MEAAGTIPALHRVKVAACWVFDSHQVRESLLMEVRLLRDTLRDAQGDIERCRYFSSEMSRREAEITQRADAKVQQCVHVQQRVWCPPTCQQVHAFKRAAGWGDTAGDSFSR